MGEWSKTIGEYGEETVSNFLQLIGWGQVSKNIPVDCLKSKLHALTGDSRQTHGIDFYYSYLSPLVDSTLKNVHISSKYTADQYKNAPGTNFKEYVLELARTVDCFNYSSDKNNYSQFIKGYKHVEDVGVLFWLSNSAASYDDLASKVSNANVSWDGPMQNLYLVDNKRISFIIQSLNYAKSKYNGTSIAFFYPNTGKNINPITKSDFGSMLPVEYFNASVLPIRIQETTGKTGLLVCTIDPFSSSDLSRLIGLAQDLSKSWSGFINISFPDFNELAHGQQVRQVKSQFRSDTFTENVMVSTYSNFFTSINQ